MPDKIFKYEEVSHKAIMELLETHNVYIVANDKRDKSYEQIKFMYAILKEFAIEFYGEYDKSSLDNIKYAFYEDYQKASDLEFYRTKVATVTEMRLFIDWLLKMMAQQYGITIALELVDESFLSSWIYANTCSRKCCVCGETNADIHHVDRVGAGHNRKKVNHTKKKVISLCRTCHSIEHDTGKLLKEKGLYGVKLTSFDFEHLGIEGDYFDEKEQNNE